MCSSSSSKRPRATRAVIVMQLRVRRSRPGRAQISPQAYFVISSWNSRVCSPARCSDRSTCSSPSTSRRIFRPCSYGSSVMRRSSRRDSSMREEHGGPLAGGRPADHPCEGRRETASAVVWTFGVQWLCGQGPTRSVCGGGIAVSGVSVGSIPGDDLGLGLGGAEAPLPLRQPDLETVRRRLLRLAFDIHDGPLQSLAAAGFGLNDLEERLSALVSADGAAATARGIVADILAELSEAERTLRTLVSMLEDGRPEIALASD